MRTISVVTVARSDYSIYLPLLKKIRADPDLRLHLIVAGMHLSREFGLTVKAIEADGFEIGDRVDMLLSSDTPESIAKSIGIGTIGFAQVYAHTRPQILVILGDRFEMHAAALAALPFKIPVAHIHGGEVTEGAIDDALRHSMTKLSHLHFVSTHEYARRVMQLGEENWRVQVTGALSLDNFTSSRLLSLPELQNQLNCHLKQPFLLVTFHPVTLEYEQTEMQIGELLTGLDMCGLSILFTMPNADTGGRLIMQQIEEFSASHPSAQVVHNLGAYYPSAMALAAAMVGNSSSGIVEAASFRLPVVNIGTRQQGRLRSANVIDVGYDHTEILAGIQTALSGAFTVNLEHLRNPFGDGHAADRMIHTLKEVDLDDRLLIKRFIDCPVTTVTEPTFTKLEA